MVTAAASAAAGELEHPGARPRPLEWLKNKLSSPYDQEIFSVAMPAFAGLALEPVVSAFNAGKAGRGSV